MTKLIFGFPRMHKELGERRDFTPFLIARLARQGVQSILEFGYGSGMGYTQEDYLTVAPNTIFADHATTYAQDYVLVLRCPTDEEISLMHPGACLISMLHYPTRPFRVQFLRDRGLEAISLDSIKDDSGRRLIEYLRSVAWNGVEAAFKLLQKTYPHPGLYSPIRNPIRVTLLGAGAVGMHVVAAATRYGDEGLRKKLVRAGVPGVQVTVIDYDLTGNLNYMHDLLSTTDVLVDATQRPDPGDPVIPNKWIAWLPNHAVLLDLSVDPYVCEQDARQVKGIEGIPQGNLDQYVFTPDDPAWDAVPSCVPTDHRRHTVSCYSWPGVYPRECMEHYGRQIQPILRRLVEKEGIQNINPNGRFFERAISRAQLSLWHQSTHNTQPAQQRSNS